MSIETQQDWNTRLGYCGCCSMPGCPSPDIVWERKSISIDSVPAFGPYAEPSELAEDYMGFLYTTITGGESFVDAASGYAYNYSAEGTLKRYYTQGSGSRTRELLYTWTGNGVDLTGSLYTRVLTHNVNNSFAQTCEADTVETIQTSSLQTPSGGNPTFNSLILEGITNLPDECTATTKKKNLESYRRHGGSIPALQGCPGPFDGDTEVGGDMTTRTFDTATLSGSITRAEIAALLAEEAYPAEWETVQNSFLFASIFSDNWPKRSNLAPPDGVWPICPNTPPFIQLTASASKLRFRFKIPSTHSGSYFKITYDIAEFPTDGSPSFVSEDDTVEWSGPGTSPSSDPSWLTDWVEIDPPNVPGQRRVVNIRYTCYRGTKYGVKPQTIGEAFVP